MERRRCYGCQEQGHIRPNCPKRTLKQVGQAAQVNVSSISQVSQVKIQDVVIPSSGLNKESETCSIALASSTSAYDQPSQRRVCFNDIVDTLTFDDLDAYNEDELTDDSDSVTSNSFDAPTQHWDDGVFPEEPRRAI